MNSVKIGLLPLYIALYDEIAPGMRPRLEAFYETIAERLEKENMTVLRTPFCRLRGEFAQAVADYEAEGADAIVTLHMAYSPSLESIDALVASRLPVIVLDTTETYDFGPQTPPVEIDYNHGIHGVMDLCSMLRRRGKPYAISAGHYKHSDVLARTAGYCRAAAAAHALPGSRVGTIGGCFKGMGDFTVTDDEMAQCFGVTVVNGEETALSLAAAAVHDLEIERELADYRENYDMDKKIDRPLLRESVRSCLTLRRWIENERLSAFTVNFLNVGGQGAALSSMPFVEACRAMQRGIGYAGEGDVLTAAFCGALCKFFPDSTFAEIFCPDWANGGLLLSHMGEMNYRIADSRPFITLKETNFTPGLCPVAGYARMRGGRATFLNIYRDERGFSLFAAPVDMQYVKQDSFSSTIRGFMTPRCPLPEFLEKLSGAGATHHSILVYDATVGQLSFFGRLLGLNIVQL